MLYGAWSTRPCWVDIYAFLSCPPCHRRKNSARDYIEKLDGLQYMGYNDPTLGRSRNHWWSRLGASRPIVQQNRDP
jgi:hypothetical protein